MMPNEVGGRTIRPYDIPFDRAPLTCYSSLGNAYTRWVPIGMPNLGVYKDVLDVVFFLYQSVEDAQNGRKFGGTGFLVSLPTPWPGHSHDYAITNWHVAIQGGASVIRLNTMDGQTEILEFGPEDWYFIPKFHDIAALPLSIKPHHKAKILEDSFLSTEEFLSEKEIGPGDDVMMIGRFVDYDGIQTNKPAIRFGHISMADASIRQPNGFDGGSFVIDMHSRTGFSGSPVFVYRTLGSEFLNFQKKILTGASHTMALLGIHWGQFPELWELHEKRVTNAVDETSLIVDGGYVDGLSGMTCVSPAYAIRRVLDLPKLQSIRAVVEENLEKEIGPASSIPRAEIAEEPPTTEGNPNHREDFNSLLDAAVAGSKPNS